jgi:hypothetical protein
MEYQFKQMNNHKYKEIIKTLLYNKLIEETDLYKNTNTFYIKTKDSIYTYYDRKTKEPISYEEYERRYKIYREKLKNTQTNYNSIFAKSKALLIQKKFIQDINQNTLLNQNRLEIYTNTNIYYKNNSYFYYDKITKKEISYDEYQTRYNNVYKVFYNTIHKNK